MRMVFIARLSKILLQRGLDERLTMAPDGCSPCARPPAACPITVGWAILPIVALMVAAGCRSAPPCPPGARLRGAAPPKGFEVWCEKTANGKEVKDGRFTLYGADGGKMLEGYYRDGVQVGEWTMWYDNGQRASVDRYRNGLQNGQHVSWYANGAKAIEGEYRDGKREGTWRRWDPNGLKSTEEVYKDGERVK